MEAAHLAAADPAVQAAPTGARAAVAALSAGLAGLQGPRTPLKPLRCKCTLNLPDSATMPVPSTWSH